MLFALLLVYVAVSYIYPGQIFPALAPYRITYWVGIAGLVVSAIWLVVKDRSALMAPQLWLFAGFTIALGISQMLAEQWLGAPLDALQRFGPSLTMFVLAVVAVDSIRKVRIVSICMVALTLWLMLQGVLAYHFGYNAQMFLFDPVKRTEYVALTDGSAFESAESTEGLDEPDFEDGDTTVRIRGLGLLHDPNDLAVGFVVALALLSVAWTPGAVFRNLAVVVMPAFVLGYGVYLTRSRGASIAVVVTALCASVTGLGRVKAVIIASIIFAAIMVHDFGGGRQLFTDTNQSTEGRFTAWIEGLEMLKSQPVFGVGYGQFLEHHEITAHNSFVLCFAETGLVGYFFWLGAIVLTFGQLQRLRQLPADTPLDRQLRQWAGTMQLAMVGFMTAVFFLSRTFVPMLYLIVGLSVAVVLIARRSERAVWSPSLLGLASLIVACEIVSIGMIYLAVKLFLL